MISHICRRGKFREASEICGYKKTKIQGLVKRQIWREGLHFVTDEAGDRLYNLDLIANWVATLGDPVAHQRACEAYLAGLASHQPNTRKPAQRKRLAA